MKYCSFCGKQLEDTAVVCDGCNNSVAAPVKKESVGVAVLNLFTDFTIIVSVFFAFVSLLVPYIDVDINIGSYSIYGYAYFEANQGCMILSFIFALIAGILALITFILALVKRAGVSEILGTVSKAIISFALFVAGIVAFTTM